tara:strand:+ start:511 stop:3141 length:2631 start_codon:yes stop_codon:yes gene_type:complete
VIVDVFSDYTVVASWVINISQLVFGGLSRLESLIKRHLIASLHWTRVGTNIFTTEMSHPANVDESRLDAFVNSKFTKEAITLYNIGRYNRIGCELREVRSGVVKKLAQSSPGGHWGAIKEMSIDELTNRPMRNFISHVSENNGGIFRTLHPETNKKNVLKPHQVEAVRHLFCQDSKVDEADKHEILCMWHTMGLGKTVTSLAAIAMAYKSKVMLKHELVDHYSKPFKAIICCPVQMVGTFYETALRWLTLAPDCYLVARKQSDLSANSIQNANIIITTPSTLSVAYFTCFWKNPQHKSIEKRNGDILYIPGFERRQRPSPQQLAQDPTLPPDQPPPTHPIFDNANFGRWDIVCIDEVGAITNSQTWTSRAIREVCGGYTYGRAPTDPYCGAVRVLIGSGTPVRGKVTELQGICQTVDIRGQHANFQEKQAWVPPAFRGPGGGNGIRKATVQTFHREYVHVQGGLKHETTKTIVRFDPHIGRLSNGIIDNGAISEFNTQVEAAINCARAASNNPNRIREVLGVLMKAITRTEQFAFDTRLGLSGAYRYRFASDNGVGLGQDIRYSLANPSQQLQLLYRIVRSRQQTGHQKVLLYCEATTMISIASAYFQHMGSVGSIHTITGSVSGATRDKTVKQFLHANNPRAVIFISAAGGEGITLCPGCEVCITFGSYPWSPSQKSQAEARIIRITQDKPVELIDLVPKRSTSEAKLEHVYVDKQDRLIAALVYNDWAKFNSQTNASQQALSWKEKLGVARAMNRVNASGNSLFPDRIHELVAQYQTEVALADEQGTQRPAPSNDVFDFLSTVTLANVMEIPPDPYPLSGFVEPSISTTADSEPTNPIFSLTGVIGGMGPSSLDAGLSTNSAIAESMNQESDSD